MRGSVSVIIPTLNRLEALREAVESVLSQSCLPNEIIVVNSGKDKLTSNMFSDTNTVKIEVLDVESLGPSAARNRGIYRANGDYIAFLDDDDLWHSEKLKIQMEYLEQHPEIYMVSSRMISIGGDIKVKKGPWISGDLFCELYMKSLIPTPTVVAKKEVFDEVGVFNEKIMRAEDYDLWLRITRSFLTAHLKAPLGWVGRGAGRLSDDKIDLRNNSIRILKEYYDPERISRRKYKKRMSELEIYLGREYVKIGEMEKGKEHFVSAVRVNPLSRRPYRYLLRYLIRDFAGSVFE